MEHGASLLGRQKVRFLLILALVGNTLISGTVAEASAIAPPSRVDLLARTRELAESVRHQGPVSLVKAPSGLRGGVLGSDNNDTWSLKDRGGLYSATTGKFRWLRTVSLVEADLATARAGDTVPITIWYLDPAHSLRAVDTHHTSAPVRGTRRSVPSTQAATAGAAKPAGLAVPAYLNNITCTSVITDPYISYPFGPFIAGGAITYCQVNYPVVGGHDPWSQAVIVTILRISPPSTVVAAGGGVGPGAVFGGAANTPCHVGGQVLFQTQLVDVVTAIYLPQYTYYNGSGWSSLWCSNPF